jgi:hypothetical protein
MERDGVAEINILNGARSLALSPDGAHLYVESPNTVAVFGRDAGSGALTFLGVERNLEDGVNGISGGDVAVSPDGEIVHASYATFARDAATGQLSFVANTGVGGTQIGVSPDGAHVYRGSDAFAMGFAGCGPTPLTGCRTSSTGTVRLLAPNTVYWRWSKGEATTLAEFGDPASTTDYALCMYDESGPPALVFRALAPAGGTCRVTNRSCWSQVGSNWKYRDAFRTPEGLLSVMLKPNVTGLAKIIVKGGRERVTLPTMPLGLPVRVQLQASTGECWESTYSSPVLNGPGGFTSPPD